LFGAVFQSGRQNRSKRLETGLVTGFPAEQALAWEPCSVLKPVRDYISCILTLFCLPVWNKAPEKECREKPV